MTQKQNIGVKEMTVLGLILRWYSHTKLASFPMLIWKGNQSVSLLKLMFVELVSSLGTN